jgi:hypothetical protein
MSYRGHVARVEYDDEAKLFFGGLAGIRGRGGADLLVTGGYGHSRFREFAVAARPGPSSPTCACRFWCRTDAPDR